ncbi:ABC transporter ATP-binding protein [Microlunatus elymi]|uniref:ABC transporter ATP-binding protein n=2 Tax=Microlunatus elymi TaxID=2596828 RepID=A0A516Q670_9ACTN|nr:ABC transporter ATP-binding protein [Microlunatus elymi]
MRYGNRDVLAGVSFDVHSGETLVILGPNGAGKTTTIEILEGFRRRSSGEVRVLGVDPDHADEGWRADIGVVLQSWRDHGKWRVGEFLAYQGSYYTPFSSASTRRPWPVHDLLEAVGLADQINTPIGRLSGGQRRRLDIAVGLVGRPALILLDEPTAGLDPEARSEFHRIIHTAGTRSDTTVLLTTHDLDEAEILASRVLILAGGSIIADGTPQELARQIAGTDEVRWTENGVPHARSVAESTGFVRELFRQNGNAIADLEVHRASLEDAYFALVREAEATRTEPVEPNAA